MTSIGVGIAIVQNGAVLLTLRSDVPVWCLPGGHSAPGESIPETAKREAREETGLEVELLDLVGIYSMPGKGRDGSCDIIFRARPSGGVLTPLTSETAEARYFAIQELPSTMIGWQSHEASDALLGKTAVVAVLDNRLSVSQVRSAHPGPEAEQQLRQLCARPNRSDMAAA